MDPQSSQLASSVIRFTAPLLVGCAFSWLLFGVLSLQLYVFYVSFPRESNGIKIFVYALYCLAGVHTGFIFHFTWTVLVKNWGSPASLAELPWTGSGHTILTGLVALLVQVYFAWRIWVLRRDSLVVRLLAILIVTVGLMQAGAALHGAITIQFTNNVADLGTMNKVAIVWLAGSFTCDIIISASMIYLLQSARRSTNYRRTHALLQRLIIRSIETGTVTAVTAGVVLGLFLRTKENYVYLAVAFLLCNIYSNVVLATLNGRLTLAGGISADNSAANYQSYRHSSGNLGNASHELAFRARTNNNINTGATPNVIHVTTTTVSDHDNWNAKSGKSQKVSPEEL